MLIEERRPIASIGEGKVPTERGSVRGLRKPQQGTVCVSDQDQICTPENDGLFTQFLKQRQPATSTGSATAPLQPPATKRARKQVGAGSGLERFMK